jgi:hypothetical protein
MRWIRATRKGLSARAAASQLSLHVLLELFQGQAFAMPVDHGMAIGADDCRNAGFL